MQITLTVADAAQGLRDEAVVDAPASAPIDDVLRELGRLVGTAMPNAVAIDGVHVDAVEAMAPVGRSRLRHGCVVTFGDAGPTAPPGTYVELRVVGGPSAGDIFPLAIGTTTIGRAGSIRQGSHDVHVDDPDVSRRHALITVGIDGVSVADCGSTNGSWLDGERVGIEPVAFPVGARLRMGSSTIVLGMPVEPALAVAPSGAGYSSVNRPPEVRPVPPPAIEIPFPVAPADAVPQRLPIVATATPLIAGLLLALLMRRPEYLLFTVVSPCMLAGQWLSDRVGHRRRRRDQHAAYHRALHEAQRALAAALRHEVACRREASPDPATIVSAACGPTRQLWQRRPGDGAFLRVVLGTGTAPAEVVATARDESPTVSLLADVPITLALPAVGVLGIAGVPTTVRAIARAIVAQSVVLHSPRDLGVVLLADDGLADTWEWLRWLPHVRPATALSCQTLVGIDRDSVAARVGELCALISARHAASAQSDVNNRDVVVVVDGAQTLRRHHPGLTEMLVRGPGVGVYAICLDDDDSRLPAECGAVASVAGSADAVLRIHGHPQRPVTADGLSLSCATRVARALAHLCDETPGSDAGRMPNAVRWLELAGLDDDLVPELLARWRKPGGGTRGLLGAGPDGAVAFDIAYDGPHALVAGTTGSGKSELLQTMVASLAIANRPDELAFVLIDYKGGAAFGACAELPHTVGLVTDLDGALVERALASLRAELKRREAMFAQVGAPHIDAYRAAGGRLPRLVIVVDEFASLAEEHPSFVGGLVGIAQRGRSLGVHLVLATQRPEGVVSADVRANTNLRICLAVTRESESRDVIDSPKAAHVDRSTPGRGYLRTGHNELQPFQCGWLGGRRERVAGADAITVSLSPFRSLCRPAPRAAALDERTSTDLDHLVASCREAARRLDLPALASPWLPPLPDVAPIPAEPDCPQRPLTALLARVDIPTEQAQHDYVVDLATAGHFLVAGSARSGRTTTLRTVAGGLASSTSVADLHLFALDCGGGLSTLATLPHCGAVIGVHEPDRARRLMSILTTELVNRQARTAAEHAGSPREYRARSHDPLPHIVLLIDGWESFVATFDDVDAGSIIEGALRLVREGAAVGMHVVVSTDRAGIFGRLASSIDTRLVLRLADRADFSLIGLPARSVPAQLPPGRGFFTDGLLEAQVCVLSDDPATSAQCAAISLIAASTHLRDAGVSASRRPSRIEELPTAVALATIETPVAPHAKPDIDRAVVVLGVGGDDASPVTVDLLDTGPGFIVTGPPRSGRSTALATVACGLRAAGWQIVAVLPRPSTLRPYADLAVDPFDLEFEHVVSDGGRRLAVLVDDAEMVADSPAAAVLDRLMRRARDSAHVVAIAGATDELSVGFRGFIVDARRNRAGLLLAPRSPLDGEILGVRLPRSTPGATACAVTAGRGLLVRAGSITHLQVALPHPTRDGPAQPQTVTVREPAAAPSWLTCTVTTPSVVPVK